MINKLLSTILYILCITASHAQTCDSISNGCHFNTKQLILPTFLVVGGMAVNKINTDNKSVNEKASVVYLSFNGTATDDGNITGKNTNEEFYLFMKNDENNVVYVISKQNYDLWSSKKIMPAQLMPGMQTYKADIASSKKLENADNTVEYYEITKLNSLVETDEID